MIIIIIGSACAAPSIIDGSSDIKEHESNVTSESPEITGHNIPEPETTYGKVLPPGQNIKAASVVKAPAASTPVSKAAVSKAAASNTAVSTAATFTSTPASGTMMDNTKKIAVYMPAMKNWVWCETLNDAVQVDVTFDPMTTAMLSEFDPDYIGDSTASLNTLTVGNYELLIVPVSQMSTAAANKIQAYINSGGCVWFLNDPCLTVDGDSGVQLTGMLGNVVSATTSSTTTINVVNDDDITNGLPATFKPAGTTSQSSIFRTFSTPNGTISGLNYQVLMSYGNAAMLVKFENQTNGARVIYSNPNMFISGGTASYFDAQNASRLFTQTKAWIMKFAQNPSGVEVTYPNSDKQLTVTSDDHECVPWDQTTIDPMINAETSLGLTPSEINTFYIIPSTYMTGDKLTYYSQYGDTHTLHPHWKVWDLSNVSVATYVANITAEKGLVNSAAGSSDYGFTSWRFPMTTYCANSMQAVANSGFIIEASNGVDGALAGNPADNTLFLPKQVLVNNAKTNMIEYEIPAGIDIDYATGAEFADANNAYSNQFKYGNFPMNFVILGHYQGMATNCTVTGWGVNSTGLTDGLKTILSTQQAANPNFANINILANYINGVRGSTITGTVDGAVTTITVTNTQPITNFTLKTTLGNVISATCDGVAANVKQDSFTGSTYVTANLATAGTHTFVISSSSTPITQVLPVANFSSNVTEGYAPLNVQFEDLSENASSISWDFNNDGVSDSTDKSPVYVYQQPGTYTVNLTATNLNGTNSKLGTITALAVQVLPVANFSTNVTEGYAPLSVQFTDSSENANSISWDFNNDGISDSVEQNPVYVYQQPGTYTVNLTATNLNGTNSKLGTITVLAVQVLPVANFSSNVTEGYVPLTVQFEDLSENASSISWDFNNDGVSDSTDKSPVYVYQQPGTYTVNLTATNLNGTNSKLGTITALAVQVLPVANFSTNVTEGYAPLSVHFTDNSENANSISWDFNNDGISDSVEQNPVYVYQQPGTYTVNLTATNLNGTNSKLGIITVKPSEITAKPKANFSGSPTAGIVPLNVSFTDMSTGVPTSWYWGFGDGSYSLDQNPSHVYNKEGKYTVTLTVRNNLGVSTAKKIRYIDVGMLPVADFTADRTLGKAPMALRFIDKSAGSPTSWYWDFGDGSTSRSKNPIHIYSKAGKYNVTLKVTNSIGTNTTMKSSYINVEARPVADFSASPKLGAVPLNVSFTDMSTETPTSWYWNFGDGSYSLDQNPSHVYSKKGKYSVSLKVTNAAGSNTKIRAGYIIVT
ncbi:PKD domain-containing protein [Methanosarcina hadiensis]|uniref:PKD domain-containing protein n=1 Tax=Methanosarcina hadiensis TaxID=3078083 RepID=UPI0039774C66